MDRCSRSITTSSSSGSRVLRRQRWSPPSVSFLGDAFNACATSAASEVDPSLLRFTRQPRRAPLSPIGNLIPRMEEEDVLVMDGVLVNYESAGSSKGTSAAMMRRNKSSEDLLCQSWEESGVCRFGSKCQFAHGKEQIRGSRIWKQKSDQEMMGVQNSKYGTISAGSYTYGGSKLLHYVSLPGPNSPNMLTPPAITAAAHGKTISSLAKEAASPTPGSSSVPSTFSWPPTEEEEAIIIQVLCGPSSRTRLPVFAEICPL